MTEDLLAAVALFRTTFAEVPDDDWHRPAGTLSWTCWETAEHVADDLFAYAGQIAPADPPTGSYLPWAFHTQREGGPENTIFVEHNGGTAGLLRAVDACGAMLAGVVAAAPPQRRAWHSYGMSDPAGFAAMGVIEILVHAADVADGLRRGGLDVTWRPPAPICARVLDRLFTDLPLHDDPWELLLWATGRMALPGHPARTSWRWDSRPVTERD